MTPFTFTNVLPQLAKQVGAYLDAQIVDESRPDCGALARIDWGLDDPGGTAGLIALCLWSRGLSLRHCELMDGLPQPELLLMRANLAADYLLQYQRPSGLTDLRDCNYDSSPDASFILQSLCPAIAMARACVGEDVKWVKLLEKVELFTRRMIQGTMEGGFHTPNHRWVISCALALASELYPEFNVKPVIDAYLAETIDVDEEGFYIERSVGVYDAICDKSLLTLHHILNCPEARDAALRNLTTDLYLLNADGTAETGLSRRQDHGVRSVPTGMIAAYMLAGCETSNPLFYSAAEHLWKKVGPLGTDYYGVSQLLVKYGEPQYETISLPVNFTRHFQKNGLWRARRNDLTVSAYKNSTRLLSVRYGQAEIGGISINQAYFGVGDFRSDEMEVNDSCVRLLSTGISNPNRPGYDMPLGRKVVPSAWQQVKSERTVRRLPPCKSELTLTERDGILLMKFATLDGMDRVPIQIAIDFLPGGTWETDDACFKPQAGQVIFLKNGYGSMRYGNDLIRIGPGANGHRMWQMRDAETAPGFVRILITFLSPAEHEWTIETLRNPYAI